MNKKVDFPPNSYPISSSILDAVAQFDQQELSWFSGYCAGLAKGKQQGGFVGSNQAQVTEPVSAVSSIVNTKVQVLYGSQTGNAEKIAESLFESVKQLGLDVELANIADFKPKDLAKKQVLLFAISTHGEGEAPDDAIEFMEFLAGKRAPKLNDARYAVLGLGDSSYEFFCQTGKDLDESLSKLGASPLLARVDCDLDYQQQVEQWIVNVSSELNQSEPQQSISQTTVSNVSGAEASYSKTNPYKATVLASQKITGAGSEKDVQHIELSIEDSGISYLPGDGVGVWATNNRKTVDEILSLVGLTGNETVSIKESTVSLLQALTEKLELSLLNKGFVTDYANKVANTSSEKSEKLLAIVNKNYSDYIANHQIADVISISPIKLDAQELVDLLKPIKPRVYSISSSPLATPDEIHVTVKLQASTNEKGERLGTASRYLLQDLQEDDEVLIFIEQNERFRLPSSETDVLMVGPGTGIAPFRSFLLEREEQEATGKNWLFFGNAYFNTEFLYQLELQKLLSDGVLSELSVAFSRDQKDKIYVQDRMLESSGEIWNWLNNNGASFYVCGDMNYMAKDVEKALLKIFENEGALTEEQAKEYLKDLKKQGRYQRDVY